MLLNVSYNNKAVTKKIEEEVGKPFTLKERWAMNGIGSPKLIITETSIEIRNLLILDSIQRASFGLLHLPRSIFYKSGL